MVLMLHQLEGESCASIAAGLGVPVGTIYSRLHGARKAFRAKYGALEQEPERQVVKVRGTDVSA